MKITAWRVLISIKGEEALPPSHPEPNPTDRMQVMRRTPKWLGRKSRVMYRSYYLEDFGQFCGTKKDFMKLHGAMFAGLVFGLFHCCYCMLHNISIYFITAIECL